MADHDTEFTDDIVCPYCGNDNCPDEIHDDQKFECYECGKEFFVTVNYEVTFSSHCLPGQHQYGPWDEMLEAMFCTRCGSCSIKRGDA